MDLKDKVAVVPGATSGIRKEIEHTFCRAGAKVCIARVSLAAAESIAAEIKEKGGVAMPVATDVTAEKPSTQEFRRCSILTETSTFW